MLQEPHRLSKEFLKGCYCRQFFELLQAGICVTDADGTIRFMNASFGKSFNLDPENVVGKNICEFFPNSALIGVINSGLADRRVPFEWKGMKAFISRFPIYDDGEIVGGLIEVHARDIDELERLLHRIQNLQKTVAHYKTKAQLLGAEYTFDDIIGDSMPMRQLRRQGYKFAQGKEVLLVTGESGTGKELMAHALHAASARSEESLVCVNCAAIPADLLEAEFFGYAEGAFTGARKGGRIGKFELADGGTIILDEIGELPLITQAKLLRVLERNEIQKVGCNTAIYSNFRLIAVTNRNLEDMVNKGLFRSDLYHRLNILHLHIPPLREHSEDIPQLTRHLLQQLERSANIPSIGISDEACLALCRYRWPGNVRELKNVLTFALYSLEADCKTIEVRHLPSQLFEKSLPAEKPAAKEEPRTKSSRDELVEALERCSGNKSKAARELGISRTELYNRLRKFSLN